MEVIAIRQYVKPHMACGHLDVMGSAVHRQLADMKNCQPVNLPNGLLANSKGQLAKWPSCKFCISYYPLLHAVETPFAVGMLTSRWVDWLDSWVSLPASWHISESTCSQSNMLSCESCVLSHRTLATSSAEWSCHSSPSSLVCAQLLTMCSIVCHLPRVTPVSHCKTPLFVARSTLSLVSPKMVC